MSLINTTVPPFKAQALQAGQFIEVTEQSLKGHWSVRIFMHAAFSFNCPTEVEDAAEHHEAFRAAGADVCVVTTDTHFAHKLWHDTSPAVGKAEFAPAGDPTHRLSRATGLQIEEEGARPARHVRRRPPGRRRDDGGSRQRDRARREGAAAQARGGAVRRRPPRPSSPARWTEGAKTLSPSLELVAKP